MSAPVRQEECFGGQQAGVRTAIVVELQRETRVPGGHDELGVKPRAVSSMVAD